MAMATSDLWMVDTNLLVYASLPLHPLHTAATNRLSGLGSGGAELWVSRQILREYLSSMTRPGQYTGSIPMASLVGDVQRFERMFRIAEDHKTVMAHLLNLLSFINIGGKQVHDANIVATMLAHGIPRLLTNNVSDFTRFSHLITVEPLVP